MLKERGAVNRSIPRSLSDEDLFVHVGSSWFPLMVIAYGALGVGAGWGAGDIGLLSAGVAGGCIGETV